MSHSTVLACLLVTVVNISVYLGVQSLCHRCEYSFGRFGKRFSQVGYITSTPATSSTTGFPMLSICISLLFHFNHSAQHVIKRFLFTFKYDYEIAT